MVTIIKLTQAAAIYKIPSYIQMAWPFQLKFEIYILVVMIFQMKERAKFWKIGLCTL